MTGNSDEAGKITLGLITSWVLGILFLLLGLGNLTEGAGVPFLLVAVLLLPPIRSFIHRKTGKSLSKPARIIFVLILMWIGVTILLPQPGMIGKTIAVARP